MKKNIKKRVLAGGLLTLSALLSGCDPNAGAGLYGPPREPTFDPGANIVEDVYGPPFDYIEQSDENAEQDSDLSDNLPEPVYGPPPGDL